MEDENITQLIRNSTPVSTPHSVHYLVHSHTRLAPPVYTAFLLVPCQPSFEPATIAIQDQCTIHYTTASLSQSGIYQGAPPLGRYFSDNILATFFFILGHRRYFHCVPRDCDYDVTIVLGMSNREVLNQVEQGYRMPKLNECPDELYEIMLECWKHDPIQRPSFETLQWKLEDFYFQDDGIYRESEMVVT